MICIIKPAKIAIYINDGRKTLEAVKRETGCTHIINGGLFESFWQPCCQMKVDGVVKVDDGNRYWGYSWNDAGDFDMRTVPDDARKNGISCVVMIRNSIKEELYYVPALGGARQRTAIGRMPDGRIVLFCTHNGTTPEQLQQKFYEIGCDSAIMLDGGGSSQCDFDGSKLSASRLVHNFICVWAEESERLEEGENVILRTGSAGSAVRKLQEKLNHLGAGLTVDGDFGGKTDVAVRNFQTYFSLDVDGVVGAQTAEQLDRAVAISGSDNALVRAAFKYIGIAEPTGDDGIISQYNKLAGTAFGNTSAWCQMFAVVAQKDAGIVPYITASCTEAKRFYQQVGAWKSTLPGVGSLLYLDWDLSGDCDHVGVVAWLEGNYIYLIEGNSAGVGADGVRLKKYDVSDKHIAGYADLSLTKEGAGKRYRVSFGSEEDARRFASQYASAIVEGE